MIVQRVRANPLAIPTTRSFDVYGDAAELWQYRTSLVLFPQDDSQNRRCLWVLAGIDLAQWLWIRDQMEPRKDLVLAWLNRLDPDRIRKLDDSSLLRLLSMRSFCARRATGIMAAGHPRAS